MTTLGLRIKTERKKLNLTQVELARRVGVTKSAISQYESGLTKKMDGDKLLALATQLKVSPEYLIVGKESEKETETQTENYFQPFDAWDSNEYLKDDECEIPYFREIELAAGDGRHEVQENHGNYLRFAASTLKKMGVQKENAACARISGNSMEPVIPDGSTIGIDKGKTSIKNGDIYAIDHDGHLRIKILYNMPSDGIRIKSYNHDEWPDEKYTDAEQIEKIKILGRVFWWSVLR